jgi:hypothetical protein
MKTSEQLTDLMTALAKARIEFPAIVRNCSATARGGREYQYADLSTIAEATSGVLATHGLVLVQGIEDGDNGQLCISSTLFHTSGQWLQCALSVPKPASMQEVGAISTYIRRYQQSSLLNIATEDDDDASSTAGATTEPKATVPASNGHAPDPRETSLEHPTEGHIAALRNLALTECGEELEVFEGRIRQMMKLPKQASVSPRLLARSMTMTTYMELFAYYRRLEAQLAKGKEASRGNAPQEAAVSQPAAASTEAPPAVPSPAGSSSAPEPSHGDAAGDPAYHKLYQEALGWGVDESEIKHTLEHHSDLAKCRNILWRGRKAAHSPLMAQAAD